ncbi:hypothetical protein C0J52_21161 [Blattella germanica]|nr:hypothetical protein C0J52_21161 [Blattella germanica]
MKGFYQIAERLRNMVNDSFWKMTKIVRAEIAWLFPVQFSASVEDLNGNSGSVSKSENKSPKNIESSLNGGHVSRSLTHDSSRNPNLEEINNTDFSEALGNLNINPGILSSSYILKLPIEQLKHLKLSTSARKNGQPRISDQDLANEVKVIQLSEIFGIRDFREVIMENISGFRSDLSIAYYILNSKFGAHQRLLTETCDAIKNGISSLLYTLEIILKRAMIIFSRMVVECDIVTLTEFKAELMKDINDAK